MTFKELSNFINIYNKKLENKFGVYSDKEKLILSSTVKLTEELGELCNEIMTYTKRQRKEKMEKYNYENLPAEFADVILAVFMLAKDMDINLENAVKNKIEKIKNNNEFFEHNNEVN